MNFADFSPLPEAPVLVLGAAGIDIVGVLRGELRAGTSNPSQIRSSFGGVARNVAENLARLGHPVRLLAAVGSDQMGERLIEQSAQAGVDISAVIRIPDRTTGAYLAVVNSKGELQLALDDMHTVAYLSPEFVRQKSNLFKEASMLFVDANLSKETLRAAITLARRAKIPICADPTSVGLADRLIPHLPHLRLITPNAAEAGILCNRSVDPARRRQTMEVAKCLVSQGVGIAIITLGQYGICYATSETSGYIPAMRTEIVDPTGGGDALTAAVIFALFNDIPLDDALRLGVSAATLTLRYSGAVVPDLTLEKLYDQLVI
ncbi:MAG: carbohydrate kinase family protein [Anaerolineales bacterium]|nr:carbohydrate kinase family protein [Anaerolineales bacterium]